MTRTTDSGRQRNSLSKVRLADVATSQLGKMLDRAKNRGTLRPYLRNPDVRWFDINTTGLQVMPFEDHEIDRFSLKPGDVVVCEGGEAGRAGVWIDGNSTVMIQKALHRVRCGPHLHNRFLVHRLMYDYFNGTLSEYYTGATIKHLTGQDLARYEFPLPPIDEQRRIAAVLDQADSLRRKRRQSIDRLNCLPQAIFREMFGDGSLTSNGFTETVLREVCTVKGGKRLPKGATYAPTPTPFRYIRVVDFADGTIHEDKILYISPDVQRKIKRYTVQAGDVIMSIAGSIGLLAEVPVSLNGANLTENAAKLEPHNRQQISSTFLAWLLRSPSCQSQIAASTGHVTIGKLALFRIEAIKIQLPSLSLQKNFEVRIAAVREELDRMLQASKLAETLFTSLQQRAFAGELFPSDCSKAIAM